MRGARLSRFMRTPGALSIRRGRIRHARRAARGRCAAAPGLSHAAHATAMTQDDNAPHSAATASRRRRRARLAAIALGALALLALMIWFGDAGRVLRALAAQAMP